MILETQALWGKSAGISGLISNDSSAANKTSLANFPSNINSVHSFAAWIMFKQRGVTSTYFSYGASGNSNNICERTPVGFGVFCGSNGNTTCACSTLPTDGVRHIAYTFDGTTRTLYYDGMPQTLLSFIEQNTGSFSNLRCFKNLNASYPELAPSGAGLLSLGFWNRALKPVEVRGLYERQNSIFQVKPRRYWTAEEAAATLSDHFLTLLGVGA